MTTTLTASAADLKLVETACAKLEGYPVKGVNGPGNNPPVIDKDPPGVNGSLGRGWTVRSHAVEIADDGTASLKIAEVTAAALKTATRATDVGLKTTAELDAVKAVVAAVPAPGGAVQEADSELVVK